MLTRLGEAAERLARCFQSETWNDLLRDITAPLEALINAQGDPRSVSIPRSLLVGTGMYTPGADAWHTQIWTGEEASWLRRGAGWCFTAGRRHGYEDQSERFNERVLQLGLNPTGRYLDLGLRTAFSGALPPLSIRLSGSSHEVSLYRLLGSRASGLRRAERRELLQSLDALTRGADVSVDLTWSPAKVRDSVMAQIAGWYVRIEKRAYAEGQPTLSDDAYGWLAHFAARVAGRRPSDLTVSDAFDVARRSVRPPSAAGHHSYWKKSLTYRPADDLATRAAKSAGVSRRTAFSRLHKAGKTLADFATESNPTSALHRWLVASAPAGRLLTDSRLLVDGLIEKGMRPGSARKFERRIRGLAPEEKQLRVDRASGRIGRQAEDVGRRTRNSSMKVRGYLTSFPA